MNPPQVNDQDYLNFLIATPRGCRGTAAARVQPEGIAAPAHDAFTRLLHRLEPDAATRWREAAGQVERHSGILVVDDSTLANPYAQKIELVQRHGSGKHPAVVAGINVITRLGTAGDRHGPGDDRLDDQRGDALTKTDHFQTWLTTAQERGFTPACGVFERGYRSLANLKLIQGWGWVWLTRLKANRLVNPDRRGLGAVGPVDPGAAGAMVPLPGYGLIRLFPMVAPDGDLEGGASHDLKMTPRRRVRFAGYAWTIEPYHRGIKQVGGVERAQVGAARTQRHHLGLGLRAFLRLEHSCYHAGSCWFEAKRAIIRPAVQAYLANPLYPLPATA